MAYSKITKKLHPSGSLARRVLIIALLLLVIPLFLQTLFLYRQEYQQKLDDVEGDLALLANERANFIDEMIEMDWQWLEQSMGSQQQFFYTSHNETISLQSGEDPYNTPKSEADFKDPISNVKPQYTTPKTETVFEDPSVNVKPLYIERIQLPGGAHGRFVAVNQSREVLYAGVAESDTTALVIPIPFTLIARDLPRAYPIQMALVDTNGTLLWENMHQELVDPLEAKDPIGQTGMEVRLRVEKSQIKGLHLQSYYLRFATLVLFVGIGGGIAVFLFTRRIAKPLRSLCTTMERVKEGASHARYKPDWMGFEINALGLQFNETLEGLLHHREVAEIEKIHREKLAEELKIGHEIQASLLPKHVTGGSGIDIATAFLASKEVNGDFYDFFKLPNGNLLIAICDTAGKGISACLFALGLRSIIRTLASVETDFSELVRKANDLYMIDAHESSMFSTLWIGIYDKKAKKITYCSQGHPPAVLVRGSQIEELWTPGISLGTQKMDVITTKEHFLEKGDLLVLYTDGIIEAHDAKNRLFGKERLYELLMHKQKRSAQQMADQIIEEVQMFSQNIPQHDDMTLLVIHFEK